VVVRRMLGSVVFPSRFTLVAVIHSSACPVQTATGHPSPRSTA
jgi:hypothetical protein